MNSKSLSNNGLLLGLVFGFVFGCGESQSAKTPQLVHARSQIFLEHGSWSLATSFDPVPAHRPDVVDCWDGSWFQEGETLEVDTRNCNYLVLAQELKVGVPKEAMIEISSWHSALIADEPAQAHLMIATQTRILWEKNIAIPSPALNYDDEIINSEAMNMGEKIYFHIHNHGINVWNLAPFIFKNR